MLHMHAAARRWEPAQGMAREGHTTARVHAVRTACVYAVRTARVHAVRTARVHAVRTARVHAVRGSLQLHCGSQPGSKQLRRAWHLLEHICRKCAALILF